MNVKELKEEIAGVPENAEVIIMSDSGSLDRVFATFDDSGKKPILILDGAYRRGVPISTTPDIFSFSKQHKEGDRNG